MIGLATTGGGPVPIVERREPERLLEAYEAAQRPMKALVLELRRQRRGEAAEAVTRALDSAWRAVADARREATR